MESPTLDHLDFKMTLMRLPRRDDLVPGFPELPRYVIFNVNGRETAERRARQNHYQSLTRLCERGGVCLSEALAILEDRDWKAMTPDEIADGLRRHADSFSI